MNIVIQHVPGKRTATFSALLSVFPGAIVIECDGRPMETFRRCLVNDAHWHFEDDVILAPDFIERARDVVCVHGMGIIRGFAQTSKVGPMPGSSYMSNLCTYFPSGYGPAIAAFSRKWMRISRHPTGFDLVVRDWLVSHRERYWLESPSLVQHAQVPSLLGYRSKYRMSPTFVTRYGKV